jgi:hypothetical protein
VGRPFCRADPPSLMFMLADSSKGARRGGGESDYAWPVMDDRRLASWSAALSESERWWKGDSGERMRADDRRRMGIGHDSAVGLWCRRATTDLRERKGLLEDDDEVGKDSAGLELDELADEAEALLSLLSVRCVRAGAVGKGGQCALRVRRAGRPDPWAKVTTHWAGRWRWLRPRPRRGKGRRQATWRAGGRALVG